MFAFIRSLWRRWRYRKWTMTVPAGGPEYWVSTGSAASGETVENWSEPVPIALFVPGEAMNPPLGANIPFIPGDNGPPGVNAASEEKPR